MRATLALLAMLWTMPAMAAECAAFGAEPWLSVQLLYGRTRHDGTLITTAEWQDYLAKSVTPRFPDGLTVLDGSGQWLGRSGTITREPSTLVLIATPPRADLRARLDAVRHAYRTQFGQESVGLIITDACVMF
jgi:hypothetical protein